LSRRHYYFVPFGQDDAIGKPTSIVADFTKIPAALECALEGEQLQPLLI
jgi:dipicolinate synthase subunit B